MPLTLITPTGCRPDAFTLCQQYMLAQKYTGDVQWIVVDDGEEESPTLDFDDRTNWELVVLRPKPFWKYKENTQLRNFREAMACVRYDKVLVIEDDDYYHSDYLTLMDERLDEGVLVGEKNTVYYNVVIRHFHQCQNTTHSSLCQTGFTQKLYPLFAQLLLNDNRKFLDLDLFQKADPKDVRLYCHTGYCIGIKGLPGRAGIGMGHAQDVRGLRWQSDVNLASLKQWLGDSARNYVRYFNGSTMESNDQVKTFQWRGQTRYCCPSCPFDAPSELELLRHWTATHSERSTQVGPTLFDGEGQEIVKEAELNVPSALRRLLEK